MVSFSRKQIQEALNQQTHPHFKAYAEQQHPNNQAAVNFLFLDLYFFTLTLISFIKARRTN